MHSDDKCRLCGSASKWIFTGMLLRNREVSYFECPNCLYVQTETPTWLDEAYAEPINVTDTGILRRNSLNARIVQATQLLLPPSPAPVVDFAGGYGLLVRQLRDCGIEALWRDEYCTNLLAKGFEHRGEAAALATAFEVFEHFVDPVSEARRIASVATTVLLSTELMPRPTPSPDTWWYYGLDHGQHIGFFRFQSLQYLADTLGRRLISDGNSYHVLTTEAMNPHLWRFLKRWNVLMLAKNRLRRRSLTESDSRSLMSRPKDRRT